MIPSILKPYLLYAKMLSYIIVAAIVWYYTSSYKDTKFELYKNAQEKNAYELLKSSVKAKETLTNKLNEKENQLQKEIQDARKTKASLVAANIANGKLLLKSSAGVCKGFTTNTSSRISNEQVRYYFRPSEKFRQLLYGDAQELKECRLKFNSLHDKYGYVSKHAKCIFDEGTK